MTKGIGIDAINQILLNLRILSGIHFPLGTTLMLGKIASNGIATNAIVNHRRSSMKIHSSGISNRIHM